MALQLALTDPRRRSACPAGYVVVRTVRVDTERQTVQVDVDEYADVAAFTAGAEPIRTRTLSPTSTAIDTIIAAILTRAYTALKARTEYLGALDV